MNKKYPPILKNFPNMVYGGDYNPDQWLDCPDILAEDDRLMKLAHINSATLNVFAWKALEPEEGVFTFEWLDETMDRMAENGVKVVLATPSGARPAWMDKNHPEVLRMNADRVRNLHGERHNHCYTSPYYRKKVWEMDQMLAKRYKDHPALGMWHISNEYGGECHCPLCQEAFRDWLREKYHNDINELNHEWWTGFWSKKFSRFEEIESPAPQGEHAIHGLNIDWLRFVTHQTKEFMDMEIKAVKEITPDVLVTTNYMSGYAGLNYWELAENLDVISWDNYPTWHNGQLTDAQTAAKVAFYHDIFRSMKQKPFLLMESTPSLVNWQFVNKLKRPGMNILSSMQAVAHGSDSVQYFQWRKGRGAAEKFHGAVVDHEGSEHTRVFKECAKLGDILSRCGGVRGTGVNAKAAVIYDYENRWAIENMNGLACATREYERTCMEHYEALWHYSAAVDVIDMTQPLEKYQLVIAPMLYMLRGGIAEKMKRFVEQGGTLVTTYVTGYVNENDLCYLGGFPGDGLKEVAGVWEEEIDALYPEDRNSFTWLDGTLSKKSYPVKEYCALVHPLEGTEVLAEYDDDFYRGMAAVTRHSYGKGQAYHIAARTEVEFLDEFYGKLAGEISLEKNFPYAEKIPEGVNIQKREGDGEVYYFFMNYVGKEQKVEFSEEVELEDVVSGERICGKEIGLEPFGVRVFVGK
jgi:beta-galactosidase